MPRARTKAVVHSYEMVDTLMKLARERDTLREAHHRMDLAQASGSEQEIARAKCNVSYREAVVRELCRKFEAIR